MADHFQIRRPDDFHVHLRTGEMLLTVLAFTARVFGRALVMPNRRIPRHVLTLEDAGEYKGEILTGCLEIGADNFNPLMTLYLTDETTPEMIIEAHRAGVIAGKAYPRDPRGRLMTTGAAQGLDFTDIKLYYEVFGTMQAVDMVLCLHGAMPGVISVDAEAAFLDVLEQIATDFPRLRIVLEHVSTRAAVRCVRRLPANVAATITVHHMVHTFDDLMDGGVNVHLVCMPILNRPHDRDALIEAAVSGEPKFFFGSDSAPHPRDAKHSGRAPFGVFSAPVAIPLLARIFKKHVGEDWGRRLERFTSEIGASFYKLPYNDGTITIVEEPWEVPAQYNGIVPYMAGQTMDFQVVT